MLPLWKQRKRKRGMGLNLLHGTPDEEQDLWRTKSCFRKGPLLGINYLDELVALQDDGSLQDQLTELQVVSESRGVDLTERHELLEPGRGQMGSLSFREQKNDTRSENICNTCSPADSPEPWRFRPSWRNSLRSRCLRMRDIKVRLFSEFNKNKLDLQLW